MRRKGILAVWTIAALATLAAACRTSNSDSELIASNRAAEAQAYERRRLAKAGFEPLAVLAGRGLEVQRVDPMWGLLDFPSVELMRDASGNTSVRMGFRGHSFQEAVPEAVWVRLAAQAGDAFIAPDPRAARRRDREVIRRAGYCHSWHELEAVLAGTERRITATPCYGDLQASSLAYAEAVARVGIDHIPICEPDRQISDIVVALETCGRRFGPPTAEHRAIINQ